MKKERKYRILRTRKVFTYVHLYRGASFALEYAKENEEGSFYNCMNCIILTAFCLEAYFNHVGSKHIKGWDEWAMPEEKLDSIAKEFNIVLNKTKRPYTSFKEVFRLRNLLAHGKTHTLKSGPWIGPRITTSIPKYPQAEWESKCQVKWVERYLTDAERVITTLHIAIEKSGYPFDSTQEFSSYLTEIHVGLPSKEE